MMWSIWQGLSTRGVLVFECSGDVTAESDAQ